MLPLAGADFPDSAQKLASALKEGFSRHGLSVKNTTIEGGEYPKIDLLSIDLSGTKATRELRAPKPGAPSQDELLAGRMEVAADPLLFEGTAFRLHIQAEKVALRRCKGEENESILTLEQASEGSMSLEIRTADLESLLHSIAASAAESHGVEIKETHIRLTSRGPKALSFQAEVVAKMMFVKAPLTITGNLDLDDALDLRVSNLALTGTGMAASLAGNFIRPQFEKIQREPISLSMLSLGEIKLRDVQLTAGDTVRLQARFGS